MDKHLLLFALLADSNMSNLKLFNHSKDDDASIINIPSSKLIKMAALGRPFQLGSLYDYRTDTIVQGESIHPKVSLLKLSVSQNKSCSALCTIFLALASTATSPLIIIVNFHDVVCLKTFI